MFLRNYKIKNTDEAFLEKNFKNFDASCLPPCYMELLQQMKRAHYIALIWNNAAVSDPIVFEPDTSGWTLTGSKCNFVWFEGLQLQPAVKDIIFDNEDSEDNFQFATINYIPYFITLLISIHNEESEYDTDEDPELEEDEEENETD